jgi:UDP-2,3-diacylglucosamine pyrophosphatase LpxH
MFDEFIGDWVPKNTNGEPYYLVHNGDVVDGVHHNSTTQFTHNITDQKAIAVKILKPIVEKCREMGGKYYHIRGTDAHAGVNGCDEEAVAKELRAVPRDGQFARFELWKRLGKGLIHFTHHIGGTSSSRYESTAVLTELTESFSESARWREQPPDMIVRGHRHRFVQVEIPSANTVATGVVVPGWQLKSGFVFKGGGRVSQPQIGGILISATKAGVFVRSKVWPIARPQEE